MLQMRDGYLQEGNFQNLSGGNHLRQELGTRGGYQ